LIRIHFVCYNEEIRKDPVTKLRGCTGFDWGTKYRLHAEDVGWPLKSSDTNINGNSNVVTCDFSLGDVELERVAA
jgi:hypothetical protein